MNWLDKKPYDFQSAQLGQLITELESLVPVKSAYLSTLREFLAQCLYFNGPGERIKLNPKHHAPIKGLLETKVSKLQGTDVYEMCVELASIKFESIEMHDGKQLYVFLNTFLPNYEKTERTRQKRLKPKRR